MSRILAAAALLLVVDAGCPFAGSSRRSAGSYELPAGHAPIPGLRTKASLAAYNKAASEVPWAEVKADILQLLDSDQVSGLLCRPRHHANPNTIPTDCILCECQPGELASRRARLQKQEKVVHRADGAPCLALLGLVP